MLAIGIMRHALRLVFSRPRAAIQVTGLLYICSSALLYAGETIFVSRAFWSGRTVVDWPYYFLLALAIFFIFWNNVAWHRFVLIDDIPRSVFPRWQGRRTLAYAGRVLQLASVGGLVGGALSLVFILIFVIVLDLAALASASVALSYLSAVLGVFLFYRLSPVFPGAALGTGVGISEAWALTKNSNGSIAALTVFSIF